MTVGDSIDHLIGEVAEAAVLRPGDTLLVRCHDSTKAEQVRELATTLETCLKDRMPGVHVLVMGGAIEQMIVHRPDGRAA